MKTRSILVRCPGYPVTFAALAPDRHLAALAASLLGAEHWTQVWDYGTVEVFERLFPSKWRETAQRLADGWLGESVVEPRAGVPRRLRGLRRAFEARHAQLCATIADELASVRDLDFVVFAVHHKEELHGVRQLALRLREKRPSLRLIATGTWLDVHGEVLAQSGRADVFDCLCVGDCELALVELAERIGRPEAWAPIPNLAPTAVGSRHLSARRNEECLDSFPEPVYTLDAYPALHDSTKVKLFTLEDSRGCAEACHACPQPALSEECVRLHSVRATCDEMVQLGRLHGARTFRFTGAGTPVFHVQTIAQAIVARRMAVCYSRPVQLCYARPDIAGTLRASGCQACSIRVDTGSQRLLDDYYARGFGVTQAEEVLRACVAADIFTVAQFVYPCPADDYHSRAETSRIINRTRPHAVEIGLPQVTPGSDWYCWAEDFGFRIAPQRYIRWITDSYAEFPAPGFSPALPYRVGERSSKKAVRENAELISEISKRGIATSVSAELALIARVAGQAGQEREFSRQTLRQFFTGDAAGLAGQVECFNRRACVPPDTMVYRPFTPVSAAVGN